MKAKAEKRRKGGEPSPPDPSLSTVSHVALLDRGTALVTIDSGPAHFSGLTGIWRIVLFGPETPALYSPVGDRLETCHLDLPCSPCYSAANHRESSCTDNQCLIGITPDFVFERLRLGPLSGTG